MRLINADALIDAINKWMPSQEEFMESAIPPVENLAVSVLMTIEEQPTVDAVLVRRGKWIRKNDGHFLQCEFCNRCIREPIGYMFKYCPNCGANMMGEKRWR